MKPTLAILAISLLAGCKHTRVGDLRSLFQSPDYIQSFEAGDLVVHVRYLPKVLTLIERSGLPDSAMISRRVLDSLGTSSMAEGLLFHVSIGPKASLEPISAEAVVNQSSGEFARYREIHAALQEGLLEKVWLVGNETRIPLANYQVENVFGITKSHSVILLFKPADLERNRKFELVFDDLLPEIARKKLEWKFPVGNNDETI